MRKTTVIYLLFLTKCYNVRSFPIDRVMLLDQLESSDLIIFGEVSYSTCYRAKNENYMEYYTITVKLNQTLYGSTSEKQIEIKYNNNWTCPAPANYVEGKEVLAFLIKDENEYHTNGLSYGTKYFNDKASKKIYTNRITNFYNRTINNPWEEKIDWLIENMAIAELKNDAISTITRSLTYIIPIAHYNDQHK